jgi:hypothetical protein
MSIARALIRHLWPWDTSGAAPRQWLIQEARLVAARERLARDYQAAQRQAGQAQLAADQGVLRAARLRLEQPLDPVTLRVKERLARGFAQTSPGFRRRVPPPLAAELSQYADSIEKMCRSHGELGARLRLAQAMLVLCGRHPGFCTPRLLRLALSAPESAWLVFHLRQKRLEDCQSTG